MPFATTMPNSGRCARIVFTSWVRWRTRKSRVLWSSRAACRSADFTGVVPKARLRRDAHGRPGHRFADRLRVRLICLPALHIRFHVRGRHDPHLVAERLKLARPVMRAGACFHADETRLEAFEKLQDLTAAQLAPEDHHAVRVDAVDLKDGLGQIDADGGRLFHGWLPSLVGFNDTPMWHIAMPEAGAVHPISGGKWLALDGGDSGRRGQHRRPARDPRDHGH